MILLDTSVLIAYDELELPADDFISSAVVLAELEFGIALATTAEVHAHRRARLARLRSAGMQWLPFMESTATFHAELMSVVHPHAPAKARAKDVMIAATAYEMGATIATLNPGDFALVSSLVPIVTPSRRSG